DVSTFSKSTPYAPHASARISQKKFDPHALLIVLTLMVLPGMGWTYFTTLKPIALMIDQQPFAITSNQTTVAGVLNDLAIMLAPEDMVSPALDSPTNADQTISIRRAQPIQIQADGEIISRRTQAKTIDDALREAGIILKPFDRVWRGDTPVNSSESLARPANNSSRAPLATLQFAIQRAFPIQVDDNGALTTIHTTAPTLGEALRQAGVVIYLGDSVTPDLGTPLAPGYQVFIRRSRAISISADGRTYQTRTRGETIADVLKDEAIELRDKDFSDPDGKTALKDNLNVTVMRVREELVTESEAIPYDTVWQADASMDIDEHQIVQSGVEGIKKRNIIMRFENGREVRRT
ncbi:MAG: DUF348 domain-containing protein, partial [Chloroflexi bacterium]|nr:DUF348 domain-containing protein [Chloroflexota bacterium]